MFVLVLVSTNHCRKIKTSILLSGTLRKNLDWVKSGMIACITETKGVVSDGLSSVIRPMRSQQGTFNQVYLGDFLRSHPIPRFWSPWCNCHQDAVRGLSKILVQRRPHTRLSSSQTSERRSKRGRRRKTKVWRIPPYVRSGKWFGSVSTSCFQFIISILSLFYQPGEKEKNINNDIEYSHKLWQTTVDEFIDWWYRHMPFRHS